MSRRQARQLVRHGHVSVNGRKVDIPSFQVKVGDEVAVRDKCITYVHIQGALQTSGGRGRPSCLDIASPEKLVARVVGQPRREDIDQNINEQLIVELYSK
jgi:small subunit ribosomal protein S4